MLYHMLQLSWQHVLMHQKRILGGRHIDLEAIRIMATELLLTDKNRNNGID